MTSEIVAVLSLVVAIVSVGVSVHLWLMSYRRVLSIGMSGSTRMDSPYDFGLGKPIKAYPRLEIRFTITNVGKVPVYVESINVMDANRTRALCFQSDEKPPLKLEPGQKEVRTAEFVEPHPDAAYLADHIKFSRQLIDSISTDRAFVEIRMSDQKTIRWFVKDVSDESYRSWPFHFSELCRNTYPHLVKPDEVKS